MAHAPLPKIVTIHNPKIGYGGSMSKLTEVLNSDSVKRLLERQNVFLQSPTMAPLEKFSWDKSNGVTFVPETSDDKTPELSIIPVMSLPESKLVDDDEDEDRHLLPSKHEGKSAIALVPIRTEPRTCGHTEPCENLVCDVNFQRLNDGAEIHPLIAVNIDSSEIDAPVTKHCESANCDALSIDHDRCRRAIIRCHRCDSTKTCDICLVVPKTRKSQMNHRNCKMRIVYKHNRATRGQILRDRMRHRELQILEAARIKKIDYSDPVNGHDRAMESLQNNSELLIIPKASLPVQQHPTIRITSVTGAAITPNTSFGNFYGGVMTRTTGNDADPGVTSSRTKESSRSEAITETPRCSNFITITACVPAKPSQPVAPVATQMQSNAFIMPSIRMVPIASLKTEPSLMHHTQGIPKFCLVADTPSQSSAAFANTPTRILPAQPARKIHQVGKTLTTSDSNKTECVVKKFKTGMRRGRRKKLGVKKVGKTYECSFCFKKFSTDWYFKLHIAKHKGEIKFTCKFCKKPFMHLYNMTKHVVTMHKKEAASADDEEKEANIEEDKKSLNCASCNFSFETKDEMEKHPCRIVCILCHGRILHGDLLLHLKAKHAMNDEKAVEEYDRQKLQRAVGRNRMRIKRRNKDSREKEEGEFGKRRNLSPREGRRYTTDEIEDDSCGSRNTRPTDDSQPELAFSDFLENADMEDQTLMQTYEESLLALPLSPDGDPLETHTSR